MNTLLKIVVNGVAVWVASLLVTGIHLADGGTTGHKIMTILLVGAVFGIVNAIVRPLAVVLGLPFLILTLGLFLFVINALMLMLTSWLSGGLNIDFDVEGFWPAVLGALVVTVVSWILDVFLDSQDRSRQPERY